MIIQHLCEFKCYFYIDVLFSNGGKGEKDGGFVQMATDLVEAPSPCYVQARVEGRPVLGEGVAMGSAPQLVSATPALA